MLFSYINMHWAIWLLGAGFTAIVIMLVYPPAVNWWMERRDRLVRRFSRQ